MERILIVEDDDSLAQMIARYLERMNYELLIKSTAIDALAAVEETSFDCLLLDINLGSDNGIQLCQKIRQVYDMPIIMISAISDTTQKSYSLNIGADDYVTKPFSLEELEARISANIRRYNQMRKVDQAPEASSAYNFEDWCFYPEQYLLEHKNGEKVYIKKVKTQILLMLLQHNGVVEKKLIHKKCYDEPFDSFDRRIDVHISQLRKILGKEMIETVHSIGFALNH
ncbi:MULTISPECIES: response regulator transcription factor [Cysteiniphilum]|uniref:DNA-binding response regulator n=1 Tax=Cysteiniphilum litorale TaxID=2056700 RepID=A0A8J2Z6Y5_9GAMM|nr:MULTISPECIES: response regulator transcription factor [Cysteiniphilum]GGG07275.1 DNA-binding response regulator [Cysteiniphilum litorale]